MPKLLPALLGLAFAGPALASPALAQITWPTEIWNPVEIAEDIILPMPCGGAMALRLVATDTEANWLADMPVQMGNDGIEGQEHSESLVSQGLAGSLSVKGAGERFYLIGKYEVTKGQYEAVMRDTCPAPVDESSLPIEGISWIEAQSFTQSYSEWLAKTAPEALRTAGGATAFLRLPTEEEWEFAARGGARVTEGQRRQKMFPIEGQLQDYVWFAGFKSCDGQAQPVGMLKPNPLGLFDIVGNVQEYTLDLYRLRGRERLHGAAGAPVARGGSCLTSEGRVRLSERDEVAQINPKTGAVNRKPFTGMRVVVASPVMTEEGRIHEFARDWKESAGMRLTIDQTANPIETLATLTKAEEDPEIRAALERISTGFEAEMATRNAVESRSAKSLVKAGFLTVRAYVLDYDLVSRTRLALEQPVDEDDEVLQLMRAQAMKSLHRAEERLTITQGALMGAVIHASEDFSAQAIEEAHRLVLREFQETSLEMTDVTQKTSEQMMQLFVDFTVSYRTARDTPPVQFFESVEAYYANLPKGN